MAHPFHPAFTWKRQTGFLFTAEAAVPIMPFSHGSGALALFLSCFPGCSGPDWEDLVVAQDFSLVQPSEILAWLGTGSLDRPLTQRMVACAKSAHHFEGELWSACKEVLGCVPRPGSRQWETAQDRWRVVLLRDALRRSDSPESLGLAVQDVYERLGHPEDMLGLWPLSGAPRSDRSQVEAFLRRIEKRLSAKWQLPMPLAS